MDEHAHAEDHTGIARLAEDMAKHEGRLLLAIGGLVSLGVVFIGILVRWPA